VVQPEAVIRSAVSADLRSTALAHKDLLPVGLFPSMGVRFLRRWHRTFLRPPHGIALVAVDQTVQGDQVVAFLLGTTDQAAHTEALLRDRRLLLELAASGSLALLRRPRLATRFVRTRGRPWLRKLLRRRAVDAHPSEAPAGGPVAVLAAVAVEPGARGRGLGAALVHRFLDEAHARDAAVAELVTVVPAEGGASTRFYERLGWRARGDRRSRDGTTVRTYAYPLRNWPQLPPGDQVTEEEGA